jgi:hypothetical protein
VRDLPIAFESTAAIQPQGSLVLTISVPCAAVLDRWAQGLRCSSLEVTDVRLNESSVYSPLTGELDPLAVHDSDCVSMHVRNRGAAAARFCAVLFLRVPGSGQ